MKLLAEKQGFYTWKVAWHDSSRHFCEILSYIFSTWYLYPSILQNMSSHFREFGSFTLENTFFAKSSGRIITENGKVYDPSILMFSIAHFQLIFCVCLQGYNASKTKLLETHNSPNAEMRAIGQRSAIYAHPEIHDGHGSKVVN